jgi:hypothetical protein
LLVCSLATGCLAAGDELDENAQEETTPATRVFNIVEAVLPAGNHDGLAGDECVALLDPEHRLRKIILVEAVTPGTTCMLSTYAAGDAVSFTWGDTAAYGISSGIAALRATLSDSNGAVHRMVGTTTSEAVALANLQAFLTLPDAEQGAQLQTFEGKRVHSLYDFEGEEEVHAEAAYQAVRITQTCENPGSPALYAQFNAGFVHGYIAGNSGSCHSGWFSKLHVYNRDWRRVFTYEYSE